MSILRQLYSAVDELKREVEDYNLKCELAESGDEFAFAEFDPSDRFCESERIGRMIAEFKNDFKSKLEELQ